MLHIDMQVFECDAEFYINKIPVRYMKYNIEQFFTLVAHKYLVDGENEIEIILWPQMEPAKARDSYVASRPKLLSAKSCAMMRVVEYKVGATPGELDGAKVIMNLEWSGEQASLSGQCMTLPFVYNLTRDLGSVFGGWLWQGGEKINLAKEANALQAYIAKIHATFANGDGILMANLAQPYLKDIGRALPAYGETAFRNDLVSSVNENMGRVDWVKPLDVDNYSLRSCAEERLVQLLDKSRQPIIGTLPQEDGTVYPFNVFLAKLSSNYWIAA